ncbi:hypothetical protein D8674_014715 [Pyrus ussuriensis x Pyrus communis]|uniref:Uncharacterized protein n=1 Tax=Pyrus ussuriensis x Pyrus communis TaxID=2448454 RepID=A0A5N5GTB5_9ROSA|nr:hypothetical protein D8674_014715 [Pyrus ussuriensis x Pyrus communis]
MSSVAVAGMMFQCVFEGSLSMQDTEIERRPYHKNCSCALHSKASICSHACQGNISFPKKQSWSDTVRVHMLLHISYNSTVSTYIFGCINIISALALYSHYYLSHFFMCFIKFSR